MTFINQRLPEQIETGALRREIEPVEVIKTDGGFEVRNMRHAQSLFEYEITYGPDDYDATLNDALYAMWRASRGGLYPFRFRDWDPKNSELSDEVIGVGDGVEAEFQIKQSWTAGGVTAERIVTRPVSPMTVKVDGVTQMAGYSIDYATGILTFTSPPSDEAEISVTGLFDIPVRFDLTLEVTGLFEHLEQFEMIKLIEVKE